MAKKGHRQLVGKVYFRGNISLKTGLHIGGSQESMQIGEISPIIRDSDTNLPYIPGSSLKGKLRSTLEKFGERIVNNKKEKLSADRHIGNQVFIHCCEDIKYALKCDVCRIFGSTGDDRSVPRGEKAENLPSPLFVRDCLLDESLISAASNLTEVKVETGIDRTSMSANPRRVERVLPDNKFNYEMIFNVEAISLDAKDQPSFPEETLRKDLNNLLSCMEIIQSEGIGGYVSRGYGKIEFTFTEFCARSLSFFMGNTDKVMGKTTGEFSVAEARGEVENIINFLKEEA